jgi:hypothetical protein
MRDESRRADDVKKHKNSLEMNVMGQMWFEEFLWFLEPMILQQGFPEIPLHELLGGLEREINELTTLVRETSRHPPDY